MNLLHMMHRAVEVQRRAEEAQCIEALTRLATHCPNAGVRVPLGRRGPFTGHDLVLGTLVEHGYEKQPDWIRHYAMDLGDYLTDGKPVQLQLI